MYLSTQMCGDLDQTYLEGFVPECENGSMLLAIVNF